MGQNAVLTGMVLNAMPIGDYDKRITVLTRERGKITAFARGARRPASQLLAVTGPFSFGEFEFFEGRSTYNLVKASISDYFRELPADPVKACYGFYFLETADFFAQEGSDESEMLKLLYQTMKALQRGTIDARLVRRVYELRLLLLQGEYPDVFSCRKCGRKERLAFFSARHAGMLCESCGSEEGAVFCDESALYAMQFILTSELKSLYTFAVSEPVLAALEKAVGSMFFQQARHAFRSLEILRSVEGSQAALLPND